MPHAQGRVLARNTLLNLFGQGLPLLVAVLTIPAVVRGLGPARFGVLSLAWVLFGYFSIFDLGLGRATTKLVSEALAERDVARVPRIAGTTFICQLALGLAAGLVLVAATPFLVGRVFKTPPDLLREAQDSFYVLALCLPFVLIAGSFRGLLEAAQRFDLINVVRAPFIASTFLIPLVGVMLQWHLPGILLGFAAAQALVAVSYGRLCLGTFPALQTVPRIDWQELRSLAQFGGWVTVSSIVSPLLVYMERFMIGMLVSMPAVAYYAAPHEVASRLLIIPASLTGTLFPAFSALQGERDLEQSSTIVARSIKYLLLVLGPIVITVVVFAHEILKTWLGAEFASRSTAVLQLVTIGVLINSVALVPFSLLQARGRPDLTAKFHLFELPIQIVVAWICIRVAGINGAALAWSVRVTIDTALLFIGVSWAHALSPGALRADRIPQTVIAIIIAGCLAGGLVRGLSLPWARGVGTLGLLGAFGAVAWRHILSAPERRQIGQWVRLQTPAR